MKKEWILSNSPLDPVKDSASRWKVPEIIAQLLLNRGITADDEARSFLEPRLNELHHPDTLSGSRVAARRILQAVNRNERIVLYGDYDVDGMTGISILWHALIAIGASPSFYVPHRLEEGYGLNEEAIRSIAADGADLLISIDCGIASVDEVEIAKKEGLSVIITDHHTPAETLPQADAIVHPTAEKESLNPDLCGAGVAFKLVWAMGLELSGSDKVSPGFRKVMMGSLPLVALGTIADVVPLLGENRILSRAGLASLPATDVVGLRMLLAEAGLRGDKVSGTDVGFKVAPRLNAAGRMGHARLAVELLTRANQNRSQEIATLLEQHNRQRQSTERKIFLQACEQVEHLDLHKDTSRGIVVASEGWHAGVIGIVAARLVDRYHKPAIMISIESGAGQGSGRSIDRFNLHDAIGSCSESLVSFGGHSMAAGLRIDSDRIDEFRDSFMAYCNEHLTGADLRPRIRLESEVSLSQLDLQTVQSIHALGPFGAGNPAPLFSSGWLSLAGEPRCVGKDARHLSASFREGDSVLRAIAFGQGDLEDELKTHRQCRLAFEPIINEFNNRKTVELRIVDMQFPEE